MGDVAPRLRHLVQSRLDGLLGTSSAVACLQGRAASLPALPERGSQEVADQLANFSFRGHDLQVGGLCRGPCEKVCHDSVRPLCRHLYSLHSQVDDAARYAPRGAQGPNFHAELGGVLVGLRAAEFSEEWSPLVPLRKVPAPNLQLAGRGALNPRGHGYFSPEDQVSRHGTDVSTSVPAPRWTGPRLALQRRSELGGGRGEPRRLG
mmetsp:Transcript_30355/g.66453  ORF Transcript_30355/g.66453 Transcript_30355/m.66453 type:complete len:206 (-) Transcript_30355:773-1390(-)